MPSNNSFILPGTKGGAGNGYWSEGGGSVVSITNGNQMNFLFETFANQPGEVKLTVTGTSTQVAATAGQGSINCIIPLSDIPSWAYPQLGPSDVSVYNKTVGGSLNNAFASGCLAFTVSRDTGNMLLVADGYTASFGSVDIPIYTVLWYDT